MIIAGSGHRPPKLGGYSPLVLASVSVLACDFLEELKPESVISGMAPGWDTALALAALRLSIPLSAYLPFKGQDRLWPDSARKLYADILSKADRVVICRKGPYESWKMQHRNKRMVDDCQLVVALWNGTPGGTANCLKYADRINREVVNLWHPWELLQRRLR